MVAQKSNSKDVRLAVLEQNMQDIKNDISQIKEDNKEMGKAVSQIKESILKLPVELDDRYASKSVEENQTKLAWFVILSVGGALLALVIK